MRLCSYKQIRMFSVLKKEQITLIDNEKKVAAAEEKTEENGTKLTDAQLKQVSGGKENANGSETTAPLSYDSVFGALK